MNDTSEYIVGQCGCQEADFEFWRDMDAAMRVATHLQKGFSGALIEQAARREVHRTVMKMNIDVTLDDLNRVIGQVADEMKNYARILGYNV